MVEMFVNENSEGASGLEVKNGSDSSMKQAKPHGY